MREGKPGRQCQLYQLELLGGLLGWRIYPKRIITENKKKRSDHQGLELKQCRSHTPPVTFNICHACLKSTTARCVSELRGIFVGGLLQTLGCDDADAALLTLYLCHIG